MGLKVAPASLHWSQPTVPHSPSCSQTLASAVSSLSSKRRSLLTGDGALFCRYVEKSSMLMNTNKLSRSRSCGSNRSRTLIIRRALTASLASFSDEEFSKKIQELALRFDLSEDEDSIAKTGNCSESGFESVDFASNCEAKFMENHRPFEFSERDEIERKANSVDIPLSLRMIKRKKQWQEGFIEAGGSAYCSMKKAFSSMVFIIRELHSYTLQMREILFYEDLQGILANVHKEMHASFVWLFQKVFSQTPTLMVYVMILLANYSVFSLTRSYPLAVEQPFVCATATEEVSVVEDHRTSKFDSSIVRTLKLSSSSWGGKTASVGGSGGGGGNHKPVASGTDGDGMFDESNYYYHTIDDKSSVMNPSRNSGEESVSRQVSVEEEASLWDSMVEEAAKMQSGSRDEALDQETMRRFVSPVDAKIDDDDQAEYFKTELLYQTGLAQEPSNPLLLANYAQFLYIVVRDFDRAEDYFKRAAKVEPKDAEALNKYANFLWRVRDDLWAAEETYLEAIAAEPDNTYYSANYAHFLWNTGGEDTCFPLSSPETSTTDGI